MAEITIDQIQPFPVANGYSTNNTTLRVWYSQTYQDSDGVQVQGGTGATGFYLSVTCTVVDGEVTVPAFSLRTTVDANDPNPQSIQCFARFFSGNTPRDWLFSGAGTPTGWIIYNPNPATSWTFAQLQLLNQTSYLANPPQTFPTTQEMIDYVQSVIGSTGYASAVNLGSTYLDVAPAVSTHPEAVGSNSPLLPTANQRAALIGSSGTPSSLNRYVTEVDSRLPTTAQAQALAGTSGSPSNSNRYVTDDDFRLPDAEAFVYADRFISLTAALSYIASTFPVGATLVISTEITQAGPLGIPANVTLLFTGSGKIEQTSGALTIQGDLWAPLKQVFFLSGSGSVSFFNNFKPPLIHPEWWGAVADGSTDCTAGVNAAIAALNSTGRGVLYFSAGVYKVTAALTTITVPCTVRGEGSGSSPSATTWVTKVVQTSRTANLFTISADSGSFEGLYLFNSNSTYGVGNAAPVNPPTAGAGIAVVATSSSTRVNLTDCVVEGFYNDVVQDGASWTVIRSHLINPVNYGLLVTNTINIDAGDWAVVASDFQSKTYMAPAALRFTSGGGGKIVACKFNTYDDPAISGATGFTDHISVDLPPGIGILLITGNSLENVSRYSIDVNNSLEVVIVGNQFGHYISGSLAAIHMVGTADSLVEGNFFRGTVVSGSPAVSLANCSKCLVGDGNANNGFGVLKQTAGTYSTGGDTYDAATLTNSWTNVGAGLASAGYCLHGGQVCLRGTVTGGSPADASIFTLPVGFRPSADEIQTGTNNTAFQRIRVNTDGTVVPEGLGSSAGAISINGISFLPAP